MITLEHEILSSPPPRRVAGRKGRWLTTERGEPPRRTDQPPRRSTTWARSDQEILAK